MPYVVVPNQPWRNLAISQFLLTVTRGQRLAVTRVCPTHVTRWHSGHLLLPMLTSRQICRALWSGINKNLSGTRINKMAIALLLLCRSCPNPEGFECLIHRLVWIKCVTHHSNHMFESEFRNCFTYMYNINALYNGYDKTVKHCIVCHTYILLCLYNISLIFFLTIQSIPWLDARGLLKFASDLR